MSGTALVDSFKRGMTLSNSGSTLITNDEDPHTGQPHQLEWRLEKHYETPMSTVYLASNNQDKTVVKRIPKSSLSMKELDALITLNASGYKHLFVTFHQWFEYQDLVYCMMEYLPLGDLTAFRSRYLPLEPEIQAITFQILQALKAMHSLGYTHRDIKPSNILIARESPLQIKICDFGISKKILDGSNASFLNTGSCTMSYAAPEVLRLDTSRTTDRINNRVDTWAVGCVVAELILSEPVFPNIAAVVQFCSFGTATVSQQLLRKRLSQSGVVKSAGVDLIMQLLEKNPAQRLSAEEALASPWISDRPQSFQEPATSFPQGLPLNELSQQNLPPFAPPSLPKVFTRNKQPTQIAYKLTEQGHKPSTLLGTRIRTARSPPKRPSRKDKRDPSDIFRPEHPNAVFY